MSHVWRLIVALGLALAVVGAGFAFAYGGTPSGPDQPVASATSPGNDTDGPTPSPVTPEPGMPAVAPVPWERAEPIDGGTALLVSWWSGVEPCVVLDHVEVAESATEVVVTLHEGYDPAATCLAMAVETSTVVPLGAPLGDRAIVDGAR